MPRSRKRFGLPLLALLSAAAAGCNRNDVEVLTRVGAKLAERAENLVERSPKLRIPLQTKITRRERVMQRLRNDKLLSGLPIEVAETGRGVKLLGTVADDATKTMILELVRNTIDIEEVEDGLGTEE